MAPTATALPESFGQVNLADLKAKVVSGHVELEEDHKPPVADNFMYDFKYNHALPTIDALGIDIREDIDAQAEADSLMQSLERVLGQGDAAGFAGMFLDYGKKPHHAYRPRLNFRRLERQAVFHLGLSNFQL